CAPRPWCSRAWARRPTSTRCRRRSWRRSRWVSRRPRRGGRAATSGGCWSDGGGPAVRKRHDEVMRPRRRHDRRLSPNCSWGLVCLALWASVQIAGCGFLARVKLASEGVEADRLQKKGKYAEAVPLAQQAVKLSEDTFGATHPTTA